MRSVRCSLFRRCPLSAPPVEWLRRSFTTATGNAAAAGGARVGGSANGNSAAADGNVTRNVDAKDVEKFSRMAHEWY